MKQSPALLSFHSHVKKVKREFDSFFIPRENRNVMRIEMLGERVSQAMVHNHPTLGLVVEDTYPFQSASSYLSYLNSRLPLYAPRYRMVPN